MDRSNGGRGDAENSADSYHASTSLNVEEKRVVADAQRLENWKRWGPYLSERQWGTVREDYSATGDCWNYFPVSMTRFTARKLRNQT